MISIKRTAQPLGGTIELTPSKSITNRLLIIRYLSDNKFSIRNQATARDSVLLNEILTHRTTLIDAKDAGTVFRFLTAVLSVSEGEFILTGTDRMKQRPVGSLVDALKSIGAEIYYEEQKNFPPLRINGKQLDGGKVRVDASVSSQFVSALLLIAPTLKNGLEIEIVGDISSYSYINMTIQIMRQFGIYVVENNNSIYIQHKEYDCSDVFVENDWSAASFWYLICALAENSNFFLKGLNDNSIQGDTVIASIMEEFGVKTEYINGDIRIHHSPLKKLPAFFTYDFISHPDLVIPVAVLCAALKVSCKLTGVKNLRIKESDRLQALKMELEKTGSAVEIEDDSISIIPVKLIFESIIDTHNDHRIAMAFAALGVFGSVRLNDGSVAGKSYPEFWGQLSMAGFKVE